MSNNSLSNINLRSLKMVLGVILIFVSIYTGTTGLHSIQGYYNSVNDKENLGVELETTDKASDILGVYTSYFRNNERIFSSKYNFTQEILSEWSDYRSDVFNKLVDSYDTVDSLFWSSWYNGILSILTFFGGFKVFKLSIMRDKE